MVVSGTAFFKMIICLYRGSSAADTAPSPDRWRIRQKIRRALRLLCVGIRMRRRLRHRGGTAALRLCARALPFLCNRHCL